MWLAWGGVKWFILLLGTHREDVYANHCYPACCTSTYLLTDLGVGDGDEAANVP